METIVIDNENMDKDKEIQYAILGMVLCPLYIKLMSQLSMLIAFPTSVTTTVYYVGIWLLVGIYVCRNTRAAVINFFQIGIMVFAFSLACTILGETGSEYVFKYTIQELVTFQPMTLFFTAMYMFFGISIQTFDHFVVRLHAVSKVGIVFGGLIILFGLLSGNALHYDDMNYAYALCLIICCLIAGYSREDLPYIIIGIVCLLLAGTRGPLVCVMVAFISRSLFDGKNIRRILIRFTLGITVVIILYGGVFAWILQMLMSLLSRFGITNLRILDYMNSGMLLDSSGRDDFSRIIMDAIKEKPFFGYGIGGDRILLQSDRYCHNIVLEVIVSLGFVIGIAIIIWIAARFLKMFFNQNESYKVIAIAFFSGEIVKLFFSSSILYSSMLFIFLGMSAVATGRIKWHNSV